MNSHPPVAVEEDSINSTTESSSTHMNLNEVHLVGADSKNQFSSSVKTVAFESSSDARSFSAVRVPEVSTKENRFREAISEPSRRQWIALAILQHSAAVFDAYSTRQAVSHGAVEDNPMLRPFAGSGAIYAATQLTPVVLDLVAYHMQRSEYPLLRRFWWMPQTLSAGLSIFSGFHNLSVAGKL
ncbi:MAG: hypothetical protein WBS17_05675 [Candidatus Acidiferrales bacterium]